MASLEDIIYDPYALINYLIDDYSTIGDPTNPVVFSLERTAVLMSSAMGENQNTLKRIYPSLSTEIADLYPHMTNDMEKDMFASPASLKFKIFLNYNDIKNEATVQDGRYKVTIPEKTIITVQDLNFTLLNPIDVTLSASDTSFVDIKTSTIEDTERNIFSLAEGNVPSSIHSDKNGSRWLTFDLTLKQINKTTYEQDVLMNEVVRQSIPINGQYYMCIATLYNEVTNDSVTMNKTHGDEIVDINIPTIMIKNNGTSLDISIPNIYQYQDNSSGRLELDIYTTEGNILRNIKADPESFTISLPETASTLEELAMQSITMMAYTDSVIDGGVNTRTFDEVKKKIISYMSGEIITPLTINQLADKVKLEGFSLQRALESVTSRSFVLSKEVIDIDNISTIPIGIDIFVGTVTVIPEDYIDNDDIYINSNNMVITSDAIFETINGITKVLTQVEKDEILTSSQAKWVTICNTRNLYSTPFYYVVDTTYDTMTTSIFDLDNPTIESRDVVLKNNVPDDLNVNTEQYEITKSDDSYIISVSLIGNDVYDGLPNESILTRLEIINDNGEKIYIDGTYSSPTVVNFIISIDMNIGQDDRFKMLNGEGELITNFINLIPTVNIYLYIIRPYINVSNDFIGYRSIMLDNPNIEILTKENIIVTLGNKLSHLWSKSSGGYTGRKFMQQTENKILTYKETIFELDTDGCPVMSTELIDDCPNTYIGPTILHNKGDAVLDTEGNPIYEYSIGDYILDDNGLPIVDTIGGITRTLDILMFDYKYKLTNIDKFKELYNDTMTRLYRWLLDDLVTYNDMTLERTQIVYRPSKLLTLAKTQGENTFSPLISPLVNIYIPTAQSSSIPTISILQHEIGKIIHAYLERENIFLEDIRTTIRDTYPSIAGVKITNIMSNDPEIINLHPASTRLYMKTWFDTDLNILYDLNVTVTKI